MFPLPLYLTENGKKQGENPCFLRNVAKTDSGQKKRTKPFLVLPVCLQNYSAGFSSVLGASAAGFASVATVGLLPVITPFGHLFAQIPQDLHFV